MRADAGNFGYRHELALAESDEDVLAIAVPFLREGAEAGERVIAMLADPIRTLVSDALGDDRGVRYLTVDRVNSRPAAALAGLRRILVEACQAGTHRVRVINEVPHPGTGASWPQWCRYEAAVNILLAEFPLWGRCLYDVRLTPDEIVRDLLDTHPYRITPGGGTEPNRCYRGPAELVARPPASAVPALTLREPSPKAARDAVLRLASRGALPHEQTEDMVTAVNEVTTNALLHGQPPVELRGWSEPGHITVAVSDGGPGPTDPFAGLAPRNGSGVSGGYGLWLAHQLADVTHELTEHGHTAWVASGPPVR